MIRIYRQAWDHACVSSGAVPNGLEAHTEHSSVREKVLEHVFLGELLRCLWRKGIREIEVLRAEVDSGGYDIAIDCNGVLRHIQLKASYLGSATSRQKINIALSRKPSGCVVWFRFDPKNLQLGPYFWLGGAPGEPIPSLGEKVARHTKGNSAGEKTKRHNIRVVNRAQFVELQNIDALVKELFGI
jgi:hypothetical protein